jgi:hypothetical protein
MLNGDEKWVRLPGSWLFHHVLCFERQPNQINNLRQIKYNQETSQPLHRHSEHAYQVGKWNQGRTGRM